MSPQDPSPGLTSQQQLSEFLHAELMHTLGAYGIACERLEHLNGKRGEARKPVLKEVADAAYNCNVNLRDGLDLPLEGDEGELAQHRHPSPFKDGMPKSFRPLTELVEAIAAFYDDCAEALELYKGRKRKDSSDAVRFVSRTEFHGDRFCWFPI